LGWLLCGCLVHDLFINASLTLLTRCFEFVSFLTPRNSPSVVFLLH